MTPQRLLAGLCWLLALIAAPAAAHTLSVAHLDIAVRADGSAATVELDLALRDLALTLPLDADRDERITWGELAAQRDAIEALAASHLALASEAGDCALSPRALATRRYDDGAYATLRLSARCPSWSGLRLRYALFFDRDPQHRALITLRQGDVAATAVARDAARVAAFGARAGAASPDGTFAQFLREGVHHILIGYDHLLFLASLLLPAALVRERDGWRPGAGFRASLLRVLGVVTAFTLAHSITLALAALGWVTPASRWVEAAIAVSVLLAALNNVWPLVTQRVWLIAFGFGLIHGFGFAGALGELGLPDGARLLALVGFNLGVEVGQIAVVLLLLPLLYALRRWRGYPPLAMAPASLAIAAIAAWWLVQRATG